MNTKELEAIINRSLAPAGFRQRRATWYRTNEETLVLVNLQKSQWGGQYYINLGVYIRSLGEKEFPKEFDCHVRARLTAIAGQESAAIEEALDLERPGISVAQREVVLRHSLADFGLAFLDARSLVPQLRALHATGELERGGVSVSKIARDLLDHPGA